MSGETQGSVGAKNILSAERIANADVVILATDIEVNTDRFVANVYIAAVQDLPLSKRIRLLQMQLLKPKCLKRVSKQPLRLKMKTKKKLEFINTF